MNHGIYRLVFNNERNSWVAVAENVRGRGKKSTRRRVAAVVLGLAAVAGGGDLAWAAKPATALPEPSSVTRPFVFAGAVNGGQPSTVGNAMTITTGSRLLGLNWQSFNIGSSASVTFVQPDATSRVLNRIWSNDPSEIMGKLTANGEIYLINQNGILFGNGAQVNVGGLLASALNLSEAMATKLLNGGLPKLKGDNLEFAYDGVFKDFANGTVIVEGGATIRTKNGGRVVLLAPKTVENKGLIESADGHAVEAILAAGGKVILTAPDDPSLRGLLVETKAFTTKDELGNSVSLDGTASNSGTINLNDLKNAGGIVSLAALAVNQKGIINASKAVNLNGTTMLVSGSTETNRLTVNQRGDVAEIDWLSGFNVGTGKIVEFVQSSPGAVAYNYVYDPDRTAADGSVLNLAGRTSIDGILKASGQFVLINEKGIDFNSNARVSASNFVASALGMNPAIVNSGLLGQTDVAKRAFYLGKTPLTYSDADPDKQQVFDQALGAFRQATINVKSGARITSGTNGYVILAGSKVKQAGIISSPGGQTVLAAGADLYLKPGYSSAVRGFTAEVNPLYVVRTKILNEQGDEVDDTIKPWLVLSRGVDANSVTNSGSVTSAFGDITLVGNEIMQAGSLLASTSVSANGSIHLLARDQLNIQGDGEPAVPSVFWRKYDDQGVVASSGTTVSSTEDNATQFVAGVVGGKLTLASGSQTVVKIDGSDGKKLTADQTFTKSSIDAVARQIVVADADIKAQGGNIRLRASEEFNEFSAFAADAPIPSKTSTPPAGVGIFVADGARIDASGTNASKSVADLFIQVELRGDEFADNPVQRDGKLRGEKAWVDIRDKVGIANLDGWTKQVGLTVNEKAASGGEISLGTTGSVIVKSGAVLDVSGGKVDYAAADVKESKAITLGGQKYRLNDAPVAATYAGLITTQRQEGAYVEGKSAGKLEVVGHSLALDGQMLARTTVGTRQREIGDALTNRYAVPYGGQLIVKDAGQHMPLANADTATEEEKIAAFTQAQITFVKGAANAAAGLSEDSSAGPRLELSQSLVKNGFSRFDITSDGRIEIPADVSLNLAAGGSFAASGRQIYVAGDISAPGGSITLKTRDMSTVSGGFPGYTDARFSTLTLASSASLSTAGRWVNDYLDGSYSRIAKAINGGSVSLTSVYDLDLQKGSVVDVSGGAWVNQKGSLKAGNAGSIALATGVTVSKEGNEKGAFNFVDDGDRRDARAFLDGTLSGYALGKGGTLSVNTSAIRFGQTFTADSHDWSRADRLAENQVGAAFDAGFVDRGGFFAFNFVGRDGVVVADGVRLSLDPVSWSLAKVSNYRYQATGSALAGFAESAVLHPDLRTAPTSLSLATRSLTYGDLLIGENAYLGVSPKGSINLSSRGQLTVLGTLEALAGTISLSRPATRTEEPYNNFPITESEEKQSESIYLGANSRLLAGGTTMLSPATRLALEAGMSASQLRSQSQYKGTLLDGGTVSIDAGLGYLVTRSGSLIDVSGKTDILNVAISTGSGLAHPALKVGSAGGTVNFAARDGMFLDGSFKAAGGSNALGGIFSLRFADVGNNGNPWGIEIPQSGDLTPEQVAMLAERQLTIYQSESSHADLWPADVNSSQYLAGNAVIDAKTHNGKAALDVASLVSGGFGSWYLKSQDEMRFSGAISATVNNQLNLNAPKFSAVNDATQLVLKAAAVQIGNSKLNVGAAPVAADIGGATAKITGLDVGFGGTFSWNGFGESTFVSKGEIHFDSVQNNVANPASGRTYNGQMTASGDLEFSAARLSPATYSDFRIDLLADPNGSITISRPPGASADVSLSAGGRLEFAASSITHDGAISAPLGEIIFNAPGGKVTLGAGSFTSVAADRDLLFGNTTESASAWKYQGQTIDAMPGKSIRIDAADTVVASGAKLDLSGGGDALAWEFTAGPGGKNDVLAASTQTFALVPGWKGFSATDGELQQGYLNSVDGSIGALKVGDRISLATNPAGLSGSYVLLPARYAILAGAYLVTVKASNDSVLGGAQKQPDGSWLVAGSRLAANADGTTTPYSSAKLTLELASSAVVAQRANYTQTSASQFFYDQSGANLAGDAGRLTAIGRNSLVFDPVITAMRVAEIAASDGRTRAGRGLELDLAAPKLLVSDSASTKDASWSWLDQNKLNGLGASSLLLGGARTNEGDKTRIETVATELLVSNSSGALSAAELMLTAKENLTVASNSRIDTKGTAEARTIVLSGDGAFLRAAEGPQADVSRDGNVSRTQGDLIIQSGATVAAQSLVFDATRDNTLDGNILPGVRQSDGSRGSGGAVNIGAGRINVVADGSSSQPTDGLTLGNADLTRFATVDQLRLTSYSTLDLYGDAVLGSSNLKELVIAAAGIAGHGNDGSSVATITAQKVSFTNPNPELDGYLAGSVLGEGALKVKATTVEFGGNSTTAKRLAKTEGFGIRGFDKVDLLATGDVLFSGVGVTAVDNVGGSGKTAALTIDAGRVATVGTANHLLVTSGKSEIKGGSAGGTTLGLGGSLEIEAKAIDVSGRIETPAGKLSLAATGSDAGDHVTIQKNAIVAAEGTRVAFADTFAYAPGGQITLSSASGNVAIDSGAVVSVAAHADGGDAGKLILVAKQGTVSAAAGSLRGDAAKGGKTEFAQGSLKVDALSVSLDNLADAVRQPLTDASTRTHFGGEWDIRARSGNLELSKTIKTESAIVAADNGSITVGSTGVIDASGSKGGKIGLYSRNGDVVLAGQLLAKGNEVVSNPSNAGTRGQGGEIELSASAAGKVKTLAGSVIDVSVADGSAATGGKVNFRAEQSASIASKDSLNVQLAGKVLGASDVGVEIVKKYSGTSLKSGTSDKDKEAIGLATINSDLNGIFSASNMTLLRKHLGFVSALQHVRAGAEITSTSTGDFIIANDLDFSALRFQGEAGVLTVKAQGNLKINSSISDGFGPGKTSPTGSYLATGRDAKISSSDASWSYRLLAGADTSAARTTAVKAPAATGNIEIASGKLVRTGTGDITLAAQGDIKLLDKAVVYTAGRNDAVTPANFVAAPGPNDTSDTGQRNYFLRNGGDLNVTAGGNISQVSTGALTDWMVTYSKGYNSTQWWARLASLQQGFAAFGGGDINLAAGGNLSKVSAVIPTNGRVPGLNGEAQPELAVINGGGNLSVKADGSINGGLFYAETGRLNITTGKSITQNPVLAMGNTTTRVTAAETASLGNILNPMSTSRNSGLLKNSSGGALGGTMATAAEYRVRIGTYGEDSRLDVTSVNGDLKLETDVTPANGVAPSQVSAVALNGSITANLLQMPGTSGQLDLLAANNLEIKTITQFDMPADLLPGIANPVGSGAASDPFPKTGSTVALPASLAHSSELWHANDFEPSRLVALTGNIIGQKTTAASAKFNEAVTVQAGNDIKNLNISVQHAHGSDVSRISAGGDIRYEIYNSSNASGKTLVTDASSPLGIRVSGPGSVEVIAKKTIDLADTKGIVSSGNLDNPYLPEGGASILAVAGATPDYESLRAYLGLAQEVSNAELRQTFFTLLRDYGRKAQSGGGQASYDKGSALAQALFPSASVGKGDIKLSVSQIKTEQGGSIQAFAPGGSIQVGVADPSMTKKASSQGMFTVRDGDIQAYVGNNFLVNQSRVFTLDGGDVMIWADKGNIDAGSGSKTQNATPPPVLIIRDGQIVLDTSNSVSGSGIGVLASRDDTPVSDMDLFAPKGAIDAGDAGLRSTGNITLGARTVLNASNIQAGGGVTGAPASAAAAAPVATMASPTSKEDRMLEESPSAAGKRNGGQGMLTVEVLGSDECNESARNKGAGEKSCNPG